MRLLSFAGAPLYAMLLATSVTSTLPKDNEIAPAWQSEIPLEILHYCLSSLTWQERVGARGVNKSFHKFLSDDKYLDQLNFHELIEKYAIDDHPGNIEMVLNLICKHPKAKATEVLDPYWSRSVSMLSPLKPANHEVLSSLDSKVVREQMPYVHMVANPETPWMLKDSTVALVQKLINLIEPPSSSILPGLTIGYWLWRDILKAAVLYKNANVVRIALLRMPEFYEHWYYNACLAYFGEFSSVGTTNPSSNSLDDDAKNKIANTTEIQPAARAEIEHASFEFRLWQRAHFWTWAIALGHDEVRDVLEPKHSKWTTGHYKRLTTIMCQKQVAKVCDYLTHVKGYNYSPDDNINFDQMTFAQKLRELPNPYLNWDISDPQKVWVAAPEESAPMPQ